MAQCRRSGAVLAAVAVAVLLLAVPGCSGKQVEPQALSGEVTIRMKGTKFVPDKLTVRTGTRIIFVNEDAMEHNVLQVAARDFGRVEPTWKSPLIAPGSYWDMVAGDPGTYPILCSWLGHYTAGMIGNLTIVD